MARKPALTITIGTVLLILAVAGFIILPEHAPRFVGGLSLGNGLYSGGFQTGLSQTLYDTLRITTWGLLIVGMVLVVVGLVNYAAGR